MSSPPAWSIGTGKRSGNRKSESMSIPGPGAYDLGNQKFSKRSGYSIGTSKRRDELRSEAPGPGAYNSPGKISKQMPKYHFGVKTVATERDVSPGPGAYDVARISRASDKKAPAFSIRCRSAQSDTARSNSPGPGAYDQSSNVRLNRAPTYRMGTSKRERFYTSQDNPGPGAYVPKIKMTKEGPCYGFGTSDRSGTENSARYVPGPGAYTLTDLTERSKKGAYIVSRKQDTSLLESSKVPGPGAYNPAMTSKKRFPAYRIGSAPRSSINRESVNVPGPGNYQLKLPRHGPVATIGSSRRQPLNESTDAPGPGAYQLNLSTNYGPKFVIIPKRNDPSQSQKDRVIPGPGAYTPSVEQIKTRNARIGIGSSKREGLYNSAYGPGPGAYNISDRKKGPRCIFGSSRRNSSLNQSQDPGPGAYNIPPKFANVPRYSMPNTGHNKF